MKDLNILKHFGVAMAITYMCFVTGCGTPNSSTQESIVKTDENQEPVIDDKEPDEMSIYLLPSFWQTQNNDTIEFSDWKGNVLVVVMFYTSCKTACPRLVADMRDIESRVSPLARKNIKYILVSIDPEVDTPERLKRFGKANQMEGEQWVFLHGSDESVREFANVLSVKYAQISPVDFSHSNIISVFDEQGILRHQQEGLGVNNETTVRTIIELSK